MPIHNIRRCGFFVCNYYLCGVYAAAVLSADNAILLLCVHCLYAYYSMLSAMVAVLVESIRSYGVEHGWPHFDWLCSGHIHCNWLYTYLTRTTIVPNIYCVNVQYNEL